MSNEPAAAAGFGPNEWLVDEIYQQFLTDKSSVDPAWWEFFEGYTPADQSPHATKAAQTVAAQPTAAAVPATRAPPRATTTAA